MDKYQTLRQQGDKLLYRAMELIGATLLTPAPLELDIKQATDLVCWNAGNLAIACRIRKPVRPEYRNHFTLRSAVASGAKTELEKIREGYGDWFFYGVSNEAETDFDKWMIIDLKVFRMYEQMYDDGYEGDIVCGEIPNGDGTSFVWYDVTTFPKHPPIIINDSDHYNKPKAPPDINELLDWTKTNDN